jgi:hypothetical protein
LCIVRAMSKHTCIWDVCFWDVCLSEHTAGSVTILLCCTVCVVLLL